MPCCTRLPLKVDNSCHQNVPAAWLEKTGCTLTIWNKLYLVYRSNKTRVDGLLLISRWVRKWLTLFKRAVKSSCKYFSKKRSLALFPPLGKRGMSRETRCYWTPLLCAFKFSCSGKVADSKKKGFFLALGARLRSGRGNKIKTEKYKCFPWELSFLF